MRQFAGAPPSARLAYYDRNPTDVSKSFIQTLAPAGATTRWTYTVPASRKAMFNSVGLQIERATAAAPVGIVQSYLFVNPPNAVYATVLTNDNTLNVPHSKVPALINLMLPAGVVVNYNTSDAGTGGTVTISGDASITEFDA